MSIKIGIVGLPNVGKSTFFNAITNSEIEAANYPFATIEPNIGSIEIYDERVDFLSKINNSKKNIYNQIQFMDIAGLVRGASKGEGLGNKFLNNIKESDAIIHIVRLFDDKNIIHVDGNVDPIRDIETINLELIFSDLEQVENWINKNNKKIIATGQGKEELELIKKIKESLENNKKINSLSLSEEEKKFIKGFNFLTAKPNIYLLNLSDSEIGNPSKNKYFNDVTKYLEKEKYHFISTQIEYEISKLNKEDQKLFLNELSLKESGLNAISKLAYESLGYKTFFTTGKEETRAWCFKDGMFAPQAAGVIHTDFEKGFIKAEIYSFESIKEHNSELVLKEKGLIRLEGKDYLMKDGDVCHFRFNV